MISRKAYAIFWEELGETGFNVLKRGVHGLTIVEALIAVEEAMKINPNRRYFYDLERKAIK